jgi:hypothetical protein
MPSAPIRIKPGTDGLLIVELPYSPDHVAKIKTVAGRRWDAKERHWTIPQSDGTLGKLLNLFPGKLVDVDPALGVVNTRDEPRPSSTPLVSVLAALHTAAQARHYPGEPNRHTNRMWRMGGGGCNFHTPSIGKTPTPRRTGGGNGSFHRNTVG